MTRALIVIDQLGRGGAQRLLLDLVPRLAAHGVEPVLCSIGRDSAMAAEFRDAEVTVEELGSSKWDPRAVSGLAAIATRHEVAVINSHLSKSIVLSAKVSRDLGLPHVIHDHAGPAWDQRAGDLRNRVEFSVMSVACLRAMRRATRVIAVSDAVREWLCQREPRLEPLIATVTNGIDLASLARVRAEAARHRLEVRAELGLPADALILLNAAGFVGIKGWDVVVDTAAALVPRVPQLHVLGVGHGAVLERIRARVQAADLDGRMQLLGLRHDVPRLLAAADVFISPSRVESDGLSVKEAMAQGLAVVVSQIPAFAANVQPGVTGELVAVDDVAGFTATIERLLRAPDERARLGAAAQAYATEQFGIDRCAEATARVLTDAARS